MIFVRALWGDESVCTYKKALWDIEHRSQRLPEGSELCVVAYGAHNAEFLCGLGYENVIQCEDKLPEEYRRINPDRPTPLSARRPGTVASGVTMWWRKLAAIRTAMTATAAQDAVWLDWDTKILRAPDQALFDMLRAGPPLQSAECPWKTPRAPWRTGANVKWSFHGGCYYIRGYRLIERAIELHAGEWALYTDETVMTWIGDHDLTGQPCENTEFYRCRKVKPGTDVSQAYFMEGDVFHWKDAPSA